MSENGTNEMLELLREREKFLEREYIEAHAEADKITAMANARLAEVRELIEKLTAKKRGRPPKKDAAPAVAEPVLVADEV